MNTKFNQNLIPYFVLIIMSILFTICDLVASMNKFILISLIFSSITLIVSFIGRYKTKALVIDDAVDDTIKFIKSNFSKSSVILSILDVLCCLLALFTGIFIIAVISRSALALRLVIIINKYKTVAFGVWSFVFIYIFKRGVRPKMEDKEIIEVGAEQIEEVADKSEKKTSFWSKIKNAIVKAVKYVFVYNPKATGTTIINAFVCSVLGYSAAVDSFNISLPQLMIGGFDIIPLLMAIVFFTLIELFGLKYAFETEEQAKARIGVEKEIKLAKKELKDAEKAEKAKEKSNAEKLEKAKALVEQRKKDAEEKAKAEAELKEIEELAKQIEAEQNK